MKKKFLMLVVVLSLLGAGTTYAAEALKVAFVDAQKVLEASKEGKKVQGSLEEYVKSRQKIIDLEEQELKQIEEELTRQGSLLSQEAKKVKQDHFQKKLMEYQKKATDLTKEVQGKRIESLKNFSKKLEDAVKQIAEKEGYTFVLDNSTDIGGVVIYSKDSFDITSKVIEQVDRVSTK
jgi:outer membrane protein